MDNPIGKLSHLKNCSFLTERKSRFVGDFLTQPLQKLRCVCLYLCLRRTQLFTFRTQTFHLILKVIILVGCLHRMLFDNHDVFFPLNKQPPAAENSIFN